MGANFCTMTVSAASKDEAEKRFQEAQEQDRHENGHCYSGGFGMANGLKFYGEPTFGNIIEAEKYLENVCEKWEEARAVKYKTPDGQTFYLIGAWCAS